jgi:hypothetical protein
MRLSKLLVLVPALALALAGCKEEGVEGPFPGCLAVNSFCSSDADCCSFGCEYGQCSSNPVEGGVCKTNNDCRSPLGTTRLCISDRCTTYAGQCNRGGACTVGGVPCCEGSCVAGFCPTDDAPIARTGADPAGRLPIHVPYQLENTSYDPDTMNDVGVSYTWTVSPATGARFDPGPNYEAPRFIADVPGTYVVTLTASAAAGATTDTITIQVENTVPAATLDPTYATTRLSRNNDLEVTVPVSDADGGPVSCAWYKIAPETSSPELITSQARCAGATGQAATGSTTVTFNADQEGVWTLRLVTSDGVPANERPWDHQITVFNDTPTIDPMPQRVGNFGAPGLPAPPIQLLAVVRDRNRDVELGNITYTWSIAAKPDGEPRIVGAVVAAGADPQFVPSAVGAYQLRVDVDDQHTYGTVSATVDVLVEPYILPLGEVKAAAHHKNSNRIVAVGKAIGGATNRLWVIDPTVPRVLHDLELAAEPKCVALSFDGTDALVGETGGWQLVTGILTTPAVGTQRGFYAADGTQLTGATAGAIAHFTAPNAARRGFATDTGGGAFELLLDATVAPFSRPAKCPSCSTEDLPRGTQLVTSPTSSATTLWLLDAFDGRLGRYAVNESNFNLSPGVAAFHGALTGTGARGLWLGADGLDLFTTTRNVYAADTLAARTGGLDSSRDHVDTILNGGLRGVSAVWTSSALTRFGGTYADAGVIQLPMVGRSGTGYPARGRFSFVKQDESAFYTILTANTGTWEWGLAKTP